MKRALSIACGALALFAGAILRAQEPAPADPVLVGAGDIADCKALSGAAKTAILLDHVEGTVFALGDTAYENGAPKEFEDCYAPTWGRHKARTRPAVGNHEYRTDFANGYYNYFGAAAGDPAKGYYSYDLGQWHVVVVNSNCKQVGGCKAGSPQEQWVRQDLAAHPAACTVAMWHHPLYSSGDHGDDKSMRDIWQATQADRALQTLDEEDGAYLSGLVLDALRRIAPNAREPALSTFSQLTMTLIAAAVRHAITLDARAARRLLALFKALLPKDLSALTRVQA